MIDWIKTNKAVFLGGIIIIVAIIYFTFTSREPAQNIINEEEWQDEEIEVMGKNEAAENVEVNEEVLIVDVKGAVKSPGVYEAKSGERVIDIITKAGGLIEKADEAQINFAMRVSDEMVLYVPVKGEEMNQSESGSVSSVTTGQSQQDGKINLNTADETELQTIPGIGPSKAASIIEYRETNGPFKVIEDIKSISGIGDKTFEKLKDSIKVN